MKLLQKMNPEHRPFLPKSRSGMSQMSLILGLVLWIGVFVALAVYMSKDPGKSKAEPIAKQPTEDRTDAPIIIDETDPDKPSKASTVVMQFPARTLPNFELQDTEGGTVSLDDLKGKRWVASFVFSRCASTCPIITAAMMDVHDRVKGKADDVMFVTITVDPEHDVPEVFHKYAENFCDGDHSRWKFLTGNQQEIYELIVKGFGLYVAENLGPDRLAGFEVAHTNRVVLVNEDGVPVATFLGTRDEDMIKLRRILLGRDDFPEAGPTLSIGDPSGQPSGLSFKLVPEKDAPDEPNSAADQPGEDEASEEESADEAKNDDDGNVQSSQMFNSNSWILTGSANSADEEPSDTQANDSNRTNSDQPNDEPKESAAEFNSALQKKLPKWARPLPTVNASLNLLATILLLAGYTAIRKGHKLTHRNLMISAFLVSIAFLGCYLTYHYAMGKFTGEHGSRFEGSGIWSIIYPLILWPHVILAAFVPLLAVRVFLLAFREDWDRHRRLARITFPIWLYVSVTGVMIYGMLYHWPEQSI